MVAVNPARDFEYRPGFLAAAQADLLLEKLRADLPWQQRDIFLFARPVLQPRLTAWCSDAGVRYSYSGLQLDPAPWHRALLELRNHLQNRLGETFNSVLANAYRDGRDSMGWHADDEPELGPQPVIASISLGAQRRMLLRPRSGGASKPLDLEHGSLVLMRARAQADWQHAIPRTRRPVGLRINLTYRMIY